MKTYKFIDGIHACMILSSNAPNDPGPEYVLADDAKDSYESGRDKGWSTGYHEGQVELASGISAKDARIAELTTEVADLKSKLSFANAMNADQDKTVGELNAEISLQNQAMADAFVDIKAK